MKHFLYGSAVVPVFFAGSWLSAGFAFVFYDQYAGSTARDWWWGPVLNGVAPALVGIPIALAFVWLLDRGPGFSVSVAGHLQRAGSWYLFIAWVLAVSYFNRENVDYGLIAQLIIWPMMSAGAAVVTDILVTWRRPRAIRETRVAVQGP